MPYLELDSHYLTMAYGVAWRGMAWLVWLVWRQQQQQQHVASFLPNVSIRSTYPSEKKKKLLNMSLDASTKGPLPTGSSSSRRSSAFLTSPRYATTLLPSSFYS